MSLSLDDLRRAWLSTNVQAFSRVVREKESSNDDEKAFHLLFGGTRFESFTDHPRIYFPLEGGRRTSAAGAFQILASTWDSLQKVYHFADFSPPNQCLAFVALVEGRGALGDVLGGDIASALIKCQKEWTSLPGAAESSSSWTVEKAIALFKSYGGRIEGEVEAAPVPVEVQPASTSEKLKMPIIALLATFGPLLAQMIPQVAKILHPDSVNKNLDAAALVLDTVVKAAGALNVQDAVEKMQASPALVTEVQKAVVTEPSIMAVLDVSGVPEARKTDVIATQAEKPFWFSPTFWVCGYLSPLIYMVVYKVLWGEFSAEIKAMVIGAIVTVLLGGIMAFYTGTSQASKTKDDTINKLTPP